MEEEKHTLYFLIKFDEQIVGATWLEHITQNDAKIGIYIALTNYRRKGIGRDVIKVLIGKCFNDMNLKRYI